MMLLCGDILHGKKTRVGAAQPFLAFASTDAAVKMSTQNWHHLVVCVFGQNRPFGVGTFLHQTPSAQMESWVHGYLTSYHYTEPPYGIGRCVCVFGSFRVFEGMTIRAAVARHGLAQHLPA